MLRFDPCKLIAACAMEFITGWGIQSAGDKAVLGPAVYGASIKNGWNASTLPAGIIVHGRLHQFLEALAPGCAAFLAFEFCSTSF